MEANISPYQLGMAERGPTPDQSAPVTHRNPPRPLPIDSVWREALTVPVHEQVETETGTLLPFFGDTTPIPLLGRLKPKEGAHRRGRTMDTYWAPQPR